MASNHSTNSRFPPPESADREGLVGVGGELTPEWLLDAYSHGIFPWPIDPRPAYTTWFSPDPRAIIEIGAMHVSRRLARTCRTGGFEISVNRDFPAVIQACGAAPGRRGKTWITPSIRQAYIDLHQLGHAHSVEVCRQGELVGGVYGVAINSFFAGESMFHRATDASKVALVHLMHRLKERGYLLFDIQQITPHTASLGATEIPRADYLQRLRAALQKPASFV